MRGQLLVVSVVASAFAGCVPPRTEIVRPPVEEWRAVEQPLSAGVTAETFYLAVVQLMAERGIALREDHPLAYTLVSEWVDTDPPLLVEVKAGNAASTPSPRSATAGARQVAFVVTVQAATVRLDIHCRERIPTAVGVVPDAFDDCDDTARPPAAIKAVGTLIREGMVRATQLQPMVPPH